MKIYIIRDDELCEEEIECNSIEEVEKILNSDLVDWSENIHDYRGKLLNCVYAYYNDGSFATNPELLDKVCNSSTEELYRIYLSIRDKIDCNM